MADSPRPRVKSEAVAQFLGALADDAEDASGLREQLLVPGRVIADRYTLRRRIGKGGMATIWEADDALKGRVVAVKFLGNEYRSAPEYRLRFEAEASAALRLRSPFSIRVHDYGVAGDTPFIAMERLYGVDLHARIAELGRLPFANVLQIARDAGAALEEAHAADIIHRDLKPKNLFIVDAATARSVDGLPDGARDREFVKLLDFGVAKHEGTAALLTATGVMLGSPFYMSPEQVRGDRDLDWRTDLWSFAAILYKSLTGVKAFDGDISRVMYLITSERHRPPTKVTPNAFVQSNGSPFPRNVARAFDAFFEKGLAKEREDRFQSARELVDAFAALG